MNKKIAQVVTGLPVEGFFDYSVDQALQEKIAVGQRVLIPFRGSRRVGCVVNLAEKSPIKNLKSIQCLLDTSPSVSPGLLKLTKKISEYYGCSWGEAVEMSLPTALRKNKFFDSPMATPSSPSSQKREAEPSTILLHDLGQSERWIFIRERIDETLLQENGVILVVPEISSIAHTVARLKDFLDVPIATLDKQLTPKEELEQWMMIRSGQANIVVGTRSAIFAPLKKLGLIIIYDEENWSYKQEQAPFYHLRDVASMRAKLERSSLLLVSSAPSAEVWHEAEKRKILKVTCGSPAKNKVQIIDMAHLDSYQKMSLSFPLRNIIEKTIQAKGKAVLFLNRRGFSTMARCNQCGYTLRCQRCDINMTYLYAKKKMVCRLCQAQAELPAVCPKCNSSYLRYLGAGIEKLESELARIFPQARIGRFDKETAVVPRDTDIIIATQAVIKVLAQLSINLIAVLEFDSELQRLDFRATQVAFSSMMHLKQSAQDQLIIQTYNPDHYCLQAISRGDFSYFYREEIKSRRELGFPPFQHLIAIGLRGAREDEVFQEANELYSRLRELPLPHLDISDPQPDVVPKLRDKYRFTIMLKSKLIQKTLPLIKTVLKKVKKRNIVITMNVDP